MKQQKFTRIVTHGGTHHADEVLAIATIFEFMGEIPYERRNKADNDDLENPEVLVLDLGGRSEPEKGNFDHHQDGNILATNVLVLNHFCNDEKLKANLLKQLFSSVDAIDRGIFTEKPETDYLNPDFNSIIRSQNHVDDGFYKALIITRLVLKSEIAKAEKVIRSEETWDNLEKQDGIAIQHTSEPILNWRQFAERDNVLLLVSPNNRQPGSYQVVSRDSALLAIPLSDEQLFRHPSGFLAVYSGFKQALKHATEIKNAYIYQAEHSIK